MRVVLRLAFGLVGAVLTMTYFLWRLPVRSRRLRAEMAREGATWTAVCRVRSGGHFLDQGRRRTGMGPAGNLLAIADALQWHSTESKRFGGGSASSWRAADVECLSKRWRRDITGMRYCDLKLRLPEGDVSFALIKQFGVAPQMFF